jgi:hypothetical protein
VERLNEIKRARFDALAGYCRQPQALFMGEEVCWLESNDEAILVVVIRDREDGDFMALLLAKDLKERYRNVSLTKFFPKPEGALAAVPALVSKLTQDFEKERSQGDEKGKPVDFFTPMVPEKRLHPSFRMVSTLEGYSPALEVIKPMMRWYEDADGNFIEQFQTTGFDARVWELYLFAMLVEAGCAFERAAPMPDFCARSVFGQVCIEATTVNPSLDGKGNPIPPPPQDTPEQTEAYDEHYMSIRFAGRLTAKLSERYWERPHVAGKPLVIAVQDFHAPMSMLTTRTALALYLYGIKYTWSQDAEGELVIKPEKFGQHVWGTKVVQSGFFNLPDSENISAVIGNASATISKFNRLGVVAGFGSKDVRLIRSGTAVRPDKDALEPIAFTHDVNDPGYAETWIEGMDVFHNPKALHPLEPMMLLGAAHHFLLDDSTIESHLPPWQPLASTTHILAGER